MRRTHSWAPRLKSIKVTVFLPRERAEPTFRQGGHQRCLAVVSRVRCGVSRVTPRRLVARRVRPEGVGTARSEGAWRGRCACSAPATGTGGAVTRGQAGKATCSAFQPLPAALARKLGSRTRGSGHRALPLPAPVCGADNGALLRDPR